MLAEQLAMFAAAATRPASVPIGPHQLRQMLFWTIVVLIVFVFSSLAIRRFTRAYKANLLRSPARPTASEDVWKMHRLPADDDGEAEP